MLAWALGGLWACNPAFGTDVSGTIASNTTWQLAQSPFVVTSALTVASNTILTIAPGVEVQIYPGISITSYGSVHAAGTASNRIRFLPPPSQPFGGSIAFSGASVSQLSATGILEYCDFTRLSHATAVLRTSYSLFSLSHCSITNIPGKFLNPANSRLTIVHNYMHDTGEAINAARCAGVIASNTILQVNGYADGIDLDEAWAGTGDTAMQLLYNVVSAGSDSNADGIDLGTAPSRVEGNTILNFGDKGISIGEDSSGTILQNVIYNCNIGIAIKDASNPLLANNTIVGCHYGIRSYPKYTLYGGRGTVTNTILWNCAIPISLEGDSTLTVAYSDIAGATAWPGVGNITNDPAFVSATDFDFRLKPGSPCIDTGLAMSWMTGSSDADGNSRIVNGTVDRGAYEYIPSLQALKILTPNGYETLEIGAVHEVKWSAYGTNWPAGSTVRLEASMNDGATWSDIAGATNVSFASYTTATSWWNTAGLAPTSACRVRVYCNQVPAVKDESDDRFTLAVPTLDHFAWAAIATPQTSEVPFAVSITAMSSHDIAITNFNAPVFLSAGSNGLPDVTVGSGGASWYYPMATTNHDARLQSIYLASDVGAARTIRSLALRVLSLPGVVLTNWTIRMKHTPLASYGATRTWDESGWTTVYRTHQSVTSTGWVSFVFSTPFSYRGGSNLMVDFSVDGSSANYSGFCAASVTSETRSMHRRENSLSGDPALWSGTNPPSYASAMVPHIRLSSRAVPMTPPAISGFSAGVWTGPITLLMGGSGLFVIADDGKGATGACNAFEVQYLADLSLTVPTSALEGATVTGQVTVSSAPATNLTVLLASDDTTEITVPAGVTILAGQTFATFSVTAVNDGVLDGTHAAGIAASVRSYGPASTVVTVRDAQSATVSVVLPASGIETAGTLVAQGVVSISAPPQSDVDVTLTSDDTTELTVPWAVTIPVGQTSAVFDVTFVDDREIDGTTTVQVTAHMDDGVDGSDTVDVLDDENRNLALLMTSPTTEGMGTLAAGGAVRLSGTWPSNLVVSLTSSATNEIVVPASVTILALQTSATFAVTVVDDALCDGTKPATVAASAAGFVNASNTVQNADDDVHHFVFSPLSTQQFRKVAFPVTLEARDVNDLRISVYTSAVVLSAAGDGGPVACAPPTASPFVAGQWVGGVVISNADTNIRLVADDGAGHTGTSGVFSIFLSVLDHFAWSAMSTSQFVNVPFPVTITAVDADEGVFADYTGTNSIMAFTPPLQTNTVGAFETNFYYPFRTSYADVRLQVIYPQALIGPSRTLAALALDVLSLPGQCMTNFTVRLKHTSMTNYTAPYTWESEGWTTVYQDNLQIPSTGWCTFAFSTPFEFNAASNLMVDFSFNNSSFSSDGYCRWTDVPVNDVRVIFYRTGSTYGDPLEWSGSSNPSPYKHYRYPCLRLVATQETVSLSLTPTATTAFVGGVWTGAVTLLQAGSNILLKTSDGNHDGVSGAFAAVSATLAALGTPEWWLVANGLTNGTFDLQETLDADSDGALNWKEWVAGTIPTNGASVFEIVTLAGTTNGRLPVTFSTVPGKVYRVWGVPSLLTNAWTPVGYSTGALSEITTGPLTAQLATVTVFIDLADNPRHYHRISVAR